MVGAYVVGYIAIVMSSLMIIILIFHKTKKPHDNVKEDNIFIHILNNPGCIIPDMIK